MRLSTHLAFCFLGVRKRRSNSRGTSMIHELANPDPVSRGAAVFPTKLNRIFFLAILLFPPSLAAQEPYDLLLKGGEVIDPKSGTHAVMDVAIRDHKIAAVEKEIPAGAAGKVIDVRGLIVVPGLVDIHTHVYAGTGLRGAYDGDNSVYPDGFTFRSCVTTVADAGSSGWKNFPDFKDRVIDRSKTRVLAFLNIVGAGMGGKVEQAVSEMDPAAAAAMAKKYPEVIVGFKTAHFEAPEWTAVDRALEARKLASLPIMVDFGVFRPERPYEQLVSQKLRPGDISTHNYIDYIPMLDAAGKVRPYLFEAQKRGVIFDVGHGGGSFVFNQAVPAVQQGFVANSISTDLHIGSMNAGMKDMTNVMSFIPAFMLPMCRSVEIELATKPCCTAGTAWLKTKLPPPWPTSKITPRFCASNKYGRTLPAASSMGM